MAPQEQECDRVETEHFLSETLSVVDSDADSSAEIKICSRQHTASTAALCLCLLAQSWLLISVFPYSGFMAIFLVPGVDEENAGSYAGLIASAFMVGRAITSYAWGKAADVYGRKFVLVSSLGLSCLFSLLFGIAPTFRLAILSRFLLGMANGIIGTAKTIVSETAYGNERLETRGMGLVMGMWGWGFLFSPALSGLLAEPVRQYPNSHFVQHFEGVLKRSPFLLPNLVSVLFCIAAIGMVGAFVPETLASEKQRSPRLIISDFVLCIRSRLSWGFPKKKSKHPSASKLIPEYGAIAIDPEKEVTHTDESDDPFDSDTVRQARLNHAESCSMLSTAFPRPSFSKGATIQPKSGRAVSEEATLLSLWSKRDTRNHLIVYWFFSFVSVAVDEAFPLFCISREEGLGLSEGSIGKVLSASGLIFAICQYFVYSSIVDEFGLRRSIQIGAMFSGPLILLLPLSLSLDSEGGEDSLSWAAFVFLSILLAVYRVFGLVFFSSISIAANRTVIPSQRGTMNGLSMLGGSFAKGLGPTFAGFLVAFAVSSGVFPPHSGAIVIFAAIGLLGSATVVMTFLLLGQEEEKAQTEQKV